MQGPHRFGDYELLHELGRGAFGVVYRAHDPHLRRDVALKLLHPAQVDPLPQARFLRELQALIRLRHANVVAVLAAGETAGRTWVALELVEGQSLEARLGLDERLPWPEALRIARQIAAALEHAHAQGVLHRDLKPANVLLTGEGEVRLADFGCARVEDATRLTSSGALLGTPRYMAPEQLLGDQARIGPACDVYGLGATLYRMLTGQPIHARADSLLTLAQEIQRARVPAPSSLVPGLPPAVDALCLRCLERDPARRYPDAATLGRAIDLALAGESAPPSPPGRRVAPLLAGAALLAVGVALGWRWSIPAPEPGRAAAQPAPDPVPALATAPTDPAPPAPVRWEQVTPGVVHWHAEGPELERADGARIALRCEGETELRRLRALDGLVVTAFCDAEGRAAAHVTDPEWLSDLTVELDEAGRARRLSGAEVVLPHAFTRWYPPSELVVSGWGWKGGRILGCELEHQLKPKVVNNVEVRLAQFLRLEDGQPLSAAPAEPTGVRLSGIGPALTGNTRVRLDLARMGRYRANRFMPASEGALAEMWVWAQVQSEREPGADDEGWLPLLTLRTAWRIERPALKPASPR